MALRRISPRPTVRVEPGPGTVLRFGAAVVLLAATPEAVPFEAELSATLGPWSGEHPPAPGDAFRALVTLLIRYRVGAPALGAAVQDGADIRLLLHGAVRAVVGGPAGNVELSGLRAVTWVDHLLTEPTGSVRITLADDAPPATGDGDELITDRAAGGGMVLTPSRLVPHDDLPPPAAQPRQRAVQTKVVDNPVAALVADDGTRTLLDRDYVLGRDPQRDPGVARGEASPVSVADPDNLISRVQVYVSVVAGIVRVRDSGSTNGTFIAAPGAKEWQRLGAEPTELPPGWSLRMGRRIFTHRDAGF